jgi:hypothetical protein
MKRASKIAVWSLLICGSVCVGRAQAQYPYNRGPSTPYQTPVLSPYINLANRNNTTAGNYFGNVRPQQIYNADVLQLNQQVTSNQQSIANLQNSELATGHPVRFLNHQRYFLNLNATAAGQTSGVGTTGAGTQGAGRPSGGAFGSSPFGSRSSGGAPSRTGR